MNYARLLIASSVVAFASSWSSALAAQPSAAVTALTGRLDALQNVQVAFDIDTHGTPPEPFLGKTLGAPGHTEKFENTHHQFSDRFSFLDGDSFIEQIPAPWMVQDSLKQNSDYPSITKIATGDREELLDHWLRPGNPHPFTGGISTPGKEKDDYSTWIEAGLGLRLFGEKSWLRAADLASASTEVDHGQVSVAVKDSTGYLHRWHFPAGGEAPDLYTVSTTDGHAFVRITLDQYKAAGAIKVPYQIIVTRIWRQTDKDGKFVKDWTVETDALGIKTCDIGSPSNTRKKYVMVWPKGSAVLDERTGRQFNVNSGDRTLTDEELRALKDPVPVDPRTGS